MVAIDGSPGAHLCALCVWFCGDFHIFGPACSYVFGTTDERGFPGVGAALLGVGVGRPENGAPAR